MFIIEFNSRVLMAKFGINFIDILEYTIKKKLQEVLIFKTYIRRVLFSKNFVKKLLNIEFNVVLCNNFYYKNLQNFC